MTRKRKRLSTSIRDNEIHKMYREICEELKEMKDLVPRTYIYEMIQEKTALSFKTIAYILNHTEEENIL